MSARPRPILKSLRRPSGGPNLLNTALPFSSSSSTLFSPHVHFPPTPSLTATFTAHSAEVYDRKPILVAPNDCNIPDRDDRVYLELPSAPHRIRPPPSSSTTNAKGGRQGRRRATKPIGSYFHPRAFEACEMDKVIIDEEVFLSSCSSSPGSSSPSSPTSSSSSELCSDSDISPPNSPPELTFSSPPSSASEGSDSDWSPRMRTPLISSCLPLRIPSKQGLESQSALSFLPHPAGRTMIISSSVDDILPHNDEDDDDVDRIPKLKRRKSGKFNSSRRGSFSDISLRPPSLDDGCLGGF